MSKVVIKNPQSVGVVVDGERLQIFEDGKICRTKSLYGKISIYEELKQYVFRNGYRMIRLKSGKFKSVARLVASAFIPNPHNYAIVSHIDHDSANNAARNLFWCTRACVLNVSVDVYRHKHMHVLVQDEEAVFKEMLLSEYNMQVQEVAE